MKIAIAQLNFTVGDLAGNVRIILDAAHRARNSGAELLITPELALTGYPPEDLLLRDDFLLDSAAALAELAREIDGIAVLVGHPDVVDNRRFNAASLLRNGKVDATYHKHKLPNHSVFDEVRYFTPGRQALMFELGGIRFGVNICADVWEPEPAMLARQHGAEILLALNASPYHLEKQLTRYETLRERVQQTGMSVIYANLVGGQDELVFDGASFAMDRDGRVTSQLPAFEEALGFIELQGNQLIRGSMAPDPGLEACIYQALCLGVHDYIGKNRFPGVVLGLSGGIDSALTLAIAVDALGKDRVHTVMMPTQYTADISLTDARIMAENLGVRHDIIPVKPIFDSFLQGLATEFAGVPADLTEENLQARIRGTLLMALSNKFGSIVLTTGNKSEIAVGYTTLYGDMAGGYAVLKDVPKTLVYRLAEYRNSLSPAIPQRIISRAPSAELRQNQADQDSLPPYEVLDAVMEMYVEDDCSPADIVNAGYSLEDVRRVVTLIDRNEYKRRQAPVGVRITHRGFGKDRRYPITSGYRPAFS
jgi:NAD+ synthase (glutamine-hydrolysing)